MDLGQILLGGFLTAAGGAGVQLWIVPRAQAKTRGRERWENDMRSLAALLEEELPRALSAYDSTGYAVRHFRGMLQQAQGNEAENAQQLVRTAEAEKREANQAVGQEMARLKILADRVKVLHPNAKLWRDIAVRRVLLSGSLLVFNHERADDPAQMTDEAWVRAWAEARTAHERLVDVVNQVARAHPMKPPPLPPNAVGRAWKKTRARVSRWRARLPAWLGGRRALPASTPSQPGSEA